ncbi:HPP family protein [Mycobacterium yunnanensis]|uniref:HPP family protein n=1 Tax=Mycobacterium yunnanensis TaxID=368477 RepID=A0A9X2YPZ5_9MYCO|nr:HPP family protein [Mycobacterium yunnanensis]MCV7423477.1 HPP family protein [Mycobacterium yunnanensis]
MSSASQAGEVSERSIASASPESSGPSRTPWYVSGAPPRQRLRVIVVETLASLAALALVGALTVVTHDPWLIPPFAASMALIVGGAHFPLAQPRNVIGGHVASSVVGVLVGLIGMDALWAGALAGALALSAMKLLRVSHSPAAATAMIAVAPVGPRWEFVVLVGCAAVILVAVGLAGNKVNGVRYPHYWW